MGIKVHHSLDSKVFTYVQQNYYLEATFIDSGKILVISQIKGGWEKSHNILARSVDKKLLYFVASSPQLSFCCF